MFRDFKDYFGFAGSTVYKFSAKSKHTIIFAGEDQWTERFYSMLDSLGVYFKKFYTRGSARRCNRFPFCKQFRDTSKLPLSYKAFVEKKYSFYIYIFKGTSALFF